MIYKKTLVLINNAIVVSSQQELKAWWYKYVVISKLPASLEPHTK